MIDGNILNLNLAQIDVSIRKKLVKLVLLVSIIIVSNPDDTNIHCEFYDFIFFIGINFRIS